MLARQAAGGSPESLGLYCKLREQHLVGPLEYGLCKLNGLRQLSVTEESYHQ